jgi:N-acetylglucosaminyldiphosphoundecaprenol N-acetyl-beta-D-mannosaminyltransferase
MINRANVLGVGVHAINIPMAIELVDSEVQGDSKGYICVTGVHGIIEAQSDSNFKNILNSAFLNVPDGMPTVWLGKIQGFSRMNRVYGPDLMLEVCKMSEQKGYTHFLYGGNKGIAEELKEKLISVFPGIKILGTFTPPFRPLNLEEEANLIDTVSKLKPDIFWVGISTPKQEKFMAEYINKLDTKLMIGVGAAFDIHAGRKKDAPNWIKQIGLQWLHRFFQEPRRLWKRYLINNPLFIYLITLQLLGLRKYSLDSNKE